MFIENWERVNINEITNIIKSKFNFQIEDAIFFNILFEMHRYFDKQFVKQLHDNKVILKQDHRNNLRLYFYYGDINYIKDLDIINFP